MRNTFSCCDKNFQSTKLTVQEARKISTTTTNPQTRILAVTRHEQRIVVMSTVCKSLVKNEPNKDPERENEKFKLLSEDYLMVLEVV